MGEPRVRRLLQRDGAVAAVRGGARRAALAHGAGGVARRLHRTGYYYAVIVIVLLSRVKLSRRRKPNIKTLLSMFEFKILSVEFS